MKKQEIKLKIASSSGNMQRVVKFVEDICDLYNIHGNYFGNIMVAVEEAVSNGIVHGNKSNPEKKVTVSVKRIPFGISITVEDQGNGFNHAEIPSPIDAICQDDFYQGKGLFLIRTLADVIVFNEKGSQIEMIFNTSGINPETSIIRKNQVQLYFNKQKTLV